MRALTVQWGMLHLWRVPLQRCDEVFHKEGELYRIMLAAAIIGGFSCLSVAMAQTEQAEHPYSIPNTMVVDLPKSQNGVAYELYVHVPPACRETEKACPAVYMLDAEYSFGVASMMVTHLSDRGRIPPVVSVAITYPDKSRYRYNRSRDYTPYYSKDDGYSEESQREAGGGPAFLKVIKKEIIPYVETHYPVLKENRTLVGHSYGGLFAAYAWMTDPGIFKNYVIVSPSLWYSERTPLAEAKKVCADSSFSREENVYMAVGEYEEQPERDRTMVSDLTAFKAILDNCEKRKVSTYLRVFPDETHASIFPAALSTGLRKLFQ